MVSMGEIWPQLGSLTGSLMVIIAICYQFFYPYAHIKFDEYGVDHLTRIDAYVAIENYLSVNSTRQAKVFRARVARNSRSVLLNIDENEEVTDVFGGVKVWWSLKTSPIRAKPIYSSNPDRDERRYYKLTFHQSYLDLITESYVPHVLTEGKAIAVRNRERKLHTNNPSRDWQGYRTCKWSHVAFEHPATFGTLALDPKKKGDLMNDLSEFSQGKEYYATIGKAWKRGYLLYGPPGTGKSTTIAAMANFLKYDVYDLELTTVKDNSELKRLMIETSSKSIIVIEDIDCSLDLTSQRKKKKKKEDNEKEDPILKMIGEEEESDSKITLSGVLNSMDGLWSACGEERIIVFTTNYVDKLEPALIRRGRMDKRIELSYCRFEEFKVLAKNYLGIDSHPLFERIGRLLEETNMTPADVAENLMPKSRTGDVEITCLKNLIEALETAKEEARKKAEEEVPLKAEKEEKEKEKSAPEDVGVEESSAKEVKESDFEDVKGNYKIVAKE